VRTLADAIGVNVRAFSVEKTMAAVIVKAIGS
jgi:hypothetical protein